MTTRFKNAIDALVYAFFNDTLAAGDCTCCAVGNICAWSYGVKMSATKQRVLISQDSEGVIHHDNWSEAVWDGAKYNRDRHKGVKAISKTGYTAKELRKIEDTFENSTKISELRYKKHTKDEIMQDQYNGLMAVLNVLCEIEGIEDPSEYKELFSYSKETIQ